MKADVVRRIERHRVANAVESRWAVMRPIPAFQDPSALS